MIKIAKIEGIDCAPCAKRVEDTIRRIDGVNSVTVNFLLQKVRIDINDEGSNVIIKSIVDTVKKIDRNYELKL